MPDTRHNDAGGENIPRGPDEILFEGPTKPAAGYSGGTGFDLPSPSTATIVKWPTVQSSREPS